MASRMLSVPPEVTVPQMPASPAPSMAAVMETISASYLAMLGHTSEWSGLLWEFTA